MLNKFLSIAKIQINPIIIRSHSWYLSKKKIPLEILDENYTDTSKYNKVELKIKQEEWKKRDRRTSVSVEQSIKYLESDVFKNNYKGNKVWVPYRRNKKGPIEKMALKTRSRCIVNGFIVVGSPCPICRDKYLVLHPNNYKLLEQFIDPATDNVYDIKKIQLCEEKFEDLITAVTIARDYGYLTFKVPFRQFDYSEFYSDKYLENLEIEKDDIVEEENIKKMLDSSQNPTNIPYAYTRLPY